MAYADVNTMITMVENLINQLVNRVTGSSMLKYKDKTGEKILNFSLPFSRINIKSELENILNISFDNVDISSPEFYKFLTEKLCELCIECGNPKTTSRMLDKLIGHFIEPRCVNPTFLTNHPLIMSPLGKMFFTIYYSLINTCNSQGKQK